MNEQNYNTIKSNYPEAICPDSAVIASYIKPRPGDGSKSDFGHALIIAGSEGKLGASILCSQAALKTGCGLVTAWIPSQAIVPLMAVLPEAMTIARTDNGKSIFQELEKYQAIGFGPGLGMDEANKEILIRLLNEYQNPFIIDADGINQLSANKSLFQFLNRNIILTPHAREFDRLTHDHESPGERIKTQIEFSQKHQVFILLKGQHTSISTPEGKIYFNSTGNSGMATAGSGDVLTGIISSLCAQGYSLEIAAVLGAYLHGFSGDMAAAKHSKTSMIASDIISCIGDFFLKFEALGHSV